MLGRLRWIANIISLSLTHEQSGLHRNNSGQRPGELWTIVGGVDMNDLLFLALNAIPLLAALALLWFGPWRPARRGGWLGH
jgi:hypothetical protein